MRQNVQEIVRAYLVIPVHQVFDLATEDFDVGRPQKQNTKSANHLSLQLQFCTGPARVSNISGNVQFLFLINNNNNISFHFSFCLDTCVSIKLEAILLGGKDFYFILGRVAVKRHDTAVACFTDQSLT